MWMPVTSPDRDRGVLNELVHRFPEESSWYGYEVTQEWVDKFTEDPNASNSACKEGRSKAFAYIIFRLPGFQLHFLDDPPDAVLVCTVIVYNRDK
jgi:hypothetical protein